METSHNGHPEQPTVLVVEDSDSVREVMLLALAGSNVRVVAVASAADATAAAAVHAIDVLVTDVVLPDSTGVVLAESLRAKHPSLRVVFVSGWFDHPLFPDLGGEVLVQKPFSLGRLKLAVDDALRDDA
jgi:two-component system, cell cycle sensor histidine kinase and response regulator CckA